MSFCAGSIHTHTPLSLSLMRSRVQITRHLHPTAPAIYQSRLHKLRPHLLTTPPFRTILSRPGLTARFEAPDDPAAGVTSITATTITSFRVAAGERKPESLVVVIISSRGNSTLCRIAGAYDATEHPRRVARTALGCLAFTTTH